MKKLICLILLMVSLSVDATEYRVMRIPKTKIIIGGKNVVAGDVVTDSDLKSIEWGDNDYVRLKEILPGNKQGRSSVLTKKTYKKTPSGNLTSVVPLSSRDVADNEVTDMVLREFLSQTFYLLYDLSDADERINIASTLPLDEHRYVEAECSSRGRKMKLRLPVENGEFYFVPAQFSSLIQSGTPSTDILVKLYYVDSESATRTEITSSMNIVVLMP